LGGSRCVQGFCACDPGYQAFNGQCQLLPTPQPFVSNNNGLLPGETCDPRCEYTGNCLRTCSGGSVCVDNVCTCPQGQTAINGQCIPYVGTPNADPPAVPTIPRRRTSRPSEPCNVTFTCLGGSACILGICQCPKGFSPRYNSSACLFEPFQFGSHKLH
jgi:NIMA (never in mitosis gene a)-related kinase